MNVTCLLENTAAAEDLEHGHGLSLFIETGQSNGSALVFDLGPDARTMRNAQRLGVDLSRAGTAVISHGHYDHGGGIAAFRQVNPGAEILMTRAAARGHFYVSLPGEAPREIGLELDPDSDPRCRLITEDTRLSGTLALFTGFGYGDFVPEGNATLFRGDKDAAMVRDDFSHELALLAAEGGRTTLFTGCAHSGILHMVATVLKRTGLDHIDTVVGGFHLLNPSTGETESKARLDILAAGLSRFPRTRFYTGHCTGEAAFAYLKGHLGDRLAPLSTGARIRL